MGRFR
ncbi:hypothetical protein LINGRAHAP2_LOCUS26253 [Linum grandiflorum]